MTLRSLAHRRRAARHRGQSDQGDSPQTARLLAPIGPADSSQPPGPRVVLLNDCRDQVNFGAGALVDGLVRLVQEHIPNVVLVPIPSHWLMDTSAGWEPFIAEGAGLRPARANFPALADQFETIADEWTAEIGGRDAHRFLSRFDGADLVVLNGEGSIYRTNQSAMRELFLAWFAKVRLGIPTIFVNGMVHLTDVVPILPAMVRKSFAVLDAVAVREPCSLRNLQLYAPDINAQLFPDSAFVFTADAARETSAVREIRDRIRTTPYFCFDPGSMPMDHRVPRNSALFDLISRLKEVGGRAVLVNSAPADLYIKGIAAETDSVYVDTLSDYREYMALVADAQFNVTGRYHNPILSAIMGVPSIPFATSSHKVHGVCETLDGLLGVPYDGTHLRPQLDDIQKRAHHFVEERADIKRRLLDVCQRRRSEVRGLGRLPASVLQRRP